MFPSIEHPYLVYLLTNTVNGKRYVGKANNLKRRLKEHRQSAARGVVTVLYHAVRKHTWGAFRAEVLETFATEKEAFAAEVRLIRELTTRVPSGYNLTNGGEGPSGSVASAETRAKLSAAFKGRTFSAESLARMSAAHKGVPVSDEAKAKMSKVRKGVPKTEEHKRRIAAGHTGKKHSAETIAKMSASQKARQLKEKAG